MVSPVDGMFRAGQISRKQWKRLSMKQPSKFSSQKSKMAPFDEKVDDEGDRAVKSVPGTKPGHINGPDQGMGASKPSRGGSVHPGKSQPRRDAINQEQKPNFPAGAGSSSRNAPGKSYSSQQPSSSNSSHMGDPGMYGGPLRRTDKPTRLKPARVP